MLRRVALLVFALAVLVPSAASASAPSVTIRDYRFVPSTIRIPIDDAVDWTNMGHHVHTSTSDLVDSAGHYWDSGRINFGDPAVDSYSSPAFQASGRFAYHCRIYPKMTGTVNVPVEVSPSSGGKSTQFRVTFANPGIGVPPGFNEDVQIKRPGSRLWRVWRKNQTNDVDIFTPDRGKGTYRFRARVQDDTTGHHSAYSPPVAITVS